MLNITNYSIKLPENAVMECFDWCKQQHFANNMRGIWILVFSLACFFAAHLIFNFSEFIEAKTGFTEDNSAKAFKFLFDAGFYLMIGFFVWFAWFM